ncbi:MAG: S1 RNA-binding domain-containing protein, partial [Comamonadaceae bacterium]
TKYTLPILPTPGEAHAKLAKRLAARVKAPSNKPAKATVAPTKETQAWEAAGLHCSANERRADEASRDVEAWLKCKYMREHLGEEYGGVVSSATTFGIFVTLDAMYVEGLVHITELGGEYFKFDEMRQELRGERTGIRYAIGSRVRVQVSRVDLDGRKIDFRLVREGEDLATRAMKDKGAAPTGAPVKASAKRSGKRGGGGGKGAHGGGHKDDGYRHADAPPAHAPRAVAEPMAVPAPAPQTAMQAFKSAVKKATNKMKGRKPRRP